MNTNKNIIRFLLFTFLSFLLLGLWIYPVTGVYFDRLDSSVYYFLNNFLKAGEKWQLFWAVTNVRIFDLAGALLILALLILHMYSDNKRDNNEKPLERFISFCLFILLSIIINKIAFSGIAGLLDYSRLSPSMALDNGIRLSEIITSFEFKDASKDCFPGDHAAVLICSTSYFFLYHNKKFGVISGLILLPFILPRLVVGAHWITDCLVGSTFVLINSLNIWINIPVFKNWPLKKLINLYKRFKPDN